MKTMDMTKGKVCMDDSTAAHGAGRGDKMPGMADEGETVVTGISMEVAGTGRKGAMKGAAASVAGRKGNTEEAIMAAAEKLFLEKGYNMTTTVMIARQAGVTHAMLHYYFRTKEQMFVRILDKFVNEILRSIRPVMKKDAPFWETMEKGISAHFDFLYSHPLLPSFIFDVARYNPELLEKYRPKFREIASGIISYHTARIDSEIASGKIRKVDPVQLLIDIGLLNMSVFLVYPAIKAVSGENDGFMKNFLEIRKRENVELIKQMLYGK